MGLDVGKAWGARCLAVLALLLEPDRQILLSAALVDGEDVVLHGNTEACLEPTPGPTVELCHPSLPGKKQADAVPVC